MLEEQLETLEKLFPEGFVLITRTDAMNIRVMALPKEDNVLKVFAIAAVQLMKDLSERAKGDDDALPEAGS